MVHEYLLVPGRLQSLTNIDTIYVYIFQRRQKGFFIVFMIFQTANQKYFLSKDITTGNYNQLRLQCMSCS